MHFAVPAICYSFPDDDVLEKGLRKRSSKMFIRCDQKCYDPNNKHNIIITLNIYCGDDSHSKDVNIKIA